MARGEFFTGQVERIAAGGAGIVRLEGKCVFIELTAPGDLIRYRIQRDHKNWAEGELLEILEASALRISPVCSHYGRCGGCNLQHMTYEAQLEAKTSILKEAFTRIGGITPPAIRLQKSAPFEYRNRVQFHFDTSPGFMERKSSRLVAIKDCPVADSGIRKALKEATLRPPPGKKRFNVYSRFNTFLREGDAGKGRVSILDKELAIDAGVFFQSNAAMLELLIVDLLAAASEADRNLPLADIYCGVGTFAAFLGGEYQGNRGFPVIDLVEENKAALDLAGENMPQGKKVNYFALSDTDWAKKQKDRSWGFMVMDPPREGLSGPFREWLARNGPEKAAYVSCDPATLARDSRVLLEGGYKLASLNLYDFYPQTSHVESLAVFTRAGSQAAAITAAGG